MRLRKRLRSKGNSIQMKEKKSRGMGGGGHE
jgi:hypothetical protein